MVNPDKTDSKPKKQQVEEMFDGISGKYDFLNHFLSMGIDKIWRRKMVSLVVKKMLPGATHFLDIATGTGDVAIKLAKKNNRFIITGADLSADMLKIGEAKIARKQLSQRIKLVKADAENLPFAPATFDAATVAFGVRNFENPDKGLKAIFETLKPGSPFVILEFTTPKHFPFKQFYTFYFHSVLPLFGRLVSKHKNAYTYLPLSVSAFAQRQDLCNLLHKAGFTDAHWKSMTFGIVCLYSAVKPLQ